MKKYASVVLVLIGIFAFAGIGYGMNSGVAGVSATSGTEKITAEQARKIALKRVAGTVEDEYTLEDDEGEVDTYVFMIKNKDGKTFEVQVEAAKGEVVSVEEYTDDADEGEDPPSLR